MACCVLLAMVLGGVIGLKASLFGLLKGAREQEWRLQEPKD